MPNKKQALHTLRPPTQHEREKQMKSFEFLVVLLMSTILNKQFSQTLLFQPDVLIITFGFKFWEIKLKLGNYLLCNIYCAVLFKSVC